MKLSTWFKKYGHHVSNHDIRTFKKLKTELQKRNWVKIQDQKIAQKLNIQEQEAKELGKEILNEVDSLISDLVEKVKTSQMFFRIIQQAWEQWGDWKLVIKEIQYYSKFVESTNMQEHVNQEFLRFKKQVNDK